MKILLVRCNQEPQMVDVPHTLESLQHLVNGMIEVVEPFEDNVVLVCSESGRNDEADFNRAANNQIDIYGDFFLCGHDGENLTDIPEEKVLKYVSLFRLARQSKLPVSEGKPLYQILH